MNKLFDLIRDKLSSNQETNEIDKTKKCLTKDLEKNINIFARIFNYPTNKDFIIRQIYIKSLHKVGVILYLDGMIDKKDLSNNVICPLLDKRLPEQEGRDNIDLLSQILRVNRADKINEVDKVKMELLLGNSILLIEGHAEAIAMNTVGFVHRNVEKPEVESVVKGPKEAFVESVELNRSLIRKRLMNEKLTTEIAMVGASSQLNLTIMYVKDIVNEELIEKVKKRISEITTDALQNLGMLEQHLEERPYSLVPTVLYTERPDRAAAFLMEGHVVLLDNSPGCLILPVTFWSFFQTGEDIYQRWPYGNFIRLLRIFAFLVALLTPSLYVALTNFHVSMVPTDLLLSIAATRENVPFPVIIEVLIMEISFELIREAGIRLPTTIGPAISIVGALILGQAAVEANIISPILVIIVALTGLASFAIPETSTNYFIRISRFIFLIFAWFMGFVGVSAAFTMLIAYLCSIKSFDVPFFSPIAPYYPSSKDTLVRPPIWKMWLRPQFLYPKDDVRKEKPKDD